MLPFGVLVATHPRRSLRSENVQKRIWHPGSLFGTCQPSSPQFGSRMHLRDFQTSFTPNSFPLALLADPHRLNPAASIFYKNIVGQGASSFQSSSRIFCLPKSFTIRRSQTPLPQPLYNPHLQTPLVCAGNKGLITPLESALTKNSPVTPLECAVPEKGGGSGAAAWKSKMESRKVRSVPLALGRNGPNLLPPRRYPDGVIHIRVCFLA